MPLNVAQEVQGEILGLEKQDKVLESPIFLDPDIPTLPIRRIDTSVAKGILRAAKEYRATVIMLSWDGTPTFRFNLLGAVHDRVALAADVPVIVGRLTMSINALDSVRIVVPPDAYSAAAARQALKLVAAIAEEINVPFSILAARRHAAYLREEVERLELELPCEFIEIRGDPVRFCKKMADVKDDLFVIATAGSEHRFRSSMGRIPEALAGATDSSILIIRYT
jgi:nucleotide-binding universal stress UspA family protein